MQKLLETLGVWYVLRTIAWMMVGEAVLKPFAHKMVHEVRQLPMVAHYVMLHEGRYVHCLECKLGIVTQVDSLSKD